MSIKKKKKGFILPASAILAATLLAAGSCRIADSVQGEKMSHRIQAVQDDKAITLIIDGKKVLSYYYAVHDVPKGVDPLYRRSGFIHPLLSPAGQVLTRIQPPDHYHHYGIWSPWTLTHINGREVDFWNLAKGQGTVRFAGLENVLCGSEAGSFQVRQEHVDFTSAKEGKVAIEEILEVRAFPDKAEDRPVWVIDIISEQRNVLDVPIELDQYRYGGGLGFRATKQWTKENCTVLTSEGGTRKDADGRRARWCDVNGRFADGQRAGIIFMSHPENREHPEPMRVWPEDAAGGRGDLFFEFCPIRLKSWTLEPAKKYTLRYRLIAYDDTIEPLTAESLWKHYVQTHGQAPKQ